MECTGLPLCLLILGGRMGMSWVDGSYNKAIKSAFLSLY